MVVADRLGCAESYTAAIHLQGGAPIWTRVQGIEELVWGRKRDDWSEAEIEVSKQDAGDTCCGKLGETRTWAFELSLYRDNDRRPVWQGPIIHKTEKRSSFKFLARDMIYWWDRRAVKPAGGEYFYPDPTDTGEIIRQLVEDGFPVDDPDRNPGLTQYAELQDTGTLSTTDRIYRDTDTIGTVVRELIGAGVDVFTVGRRIYVVPDVPQAVPYLLTDSDFLAELELRENGVDAATRGIVVGGQPLDGEGNPTQDVAPIVGIAGAPDPWFGLVERISSSPNTVDEGVADGIAGAMRSYGNPPPVDLVVPQGARLAPHAPVTINQLVPGRSFNVQLVNYCTPIRQRFRLNELEVTWTKEDIERVAVSLTSNGPAEVAA